MSLLLLLRGTLPRCPTFQTFASSSCCPGGARHYYTLPSPTKPPLLKLSASARHHYTLLTPTKPPLLKLPTTNLTSNRSSSSHHIFWTLERALAVGILFLTPIAVAAPNFILDNVWCVMSSAHMTWGSEGYVIDYLRPKVVGTAVHNVAWVVLKVLCYAALGGMIYFNCYDVGFGRAMQMLWGLTPVDEGPGEGKEEKTV